MRLDIERIGSSMETEDGGDIRGCEIYDRDHKRVGIISDIYCCQNDLTAKYAEIIPFDKSKEKIFLYPFDAIVWKGNGPAFLNSTYKDLSKYKEYDAEFVLTQEEDQLVSYSEALDLGLEFYGYISEDLEACA